MSETQGTISLKIARLEQQLKILSLQKQLSNNYPDHQAQLISKELTAQLQLQQMIEFRDKVYAPVNRQ
ncbi:MAG: hypothetical protein KDJ52_09210 [Anaerolineae bacterium]|nr:hypothetical protein [Anaerolineae bacterium]